MAYDKRYCFAGNFSVLNVQSTQKTFSCYQQKPSFCVGKENNIKYSLQTNTLDAGKGFRKQQYDGNLEYHIYLSQL